MRTLSIAVGQTTHAADAALELEAASPWAEALGLSAAPGAEAFERLDSLFSELADEQPIDEVRVAGPPAAALLPVLWLRMVWLQSDVRIVLECVESGEWSDAASNDVAARACAALADDVVNQSGENAWARWGIDVGPRRPDPEALLDALEGLIDHWDLRVNAPTLGSPMADALRRCADEGLDVVALYGAGTHTRAVGSELADPPVRIECIIDDDATRHGERLWNIPIVGMEEALGRGVRAVVLSANSIEDVLWERAAVARERGVRVVRLYTRGDDQTHGRPTR